MKTRIYFLLVPVVFILFACRLGARKPETATPTREPNPIATLAATVTSPTTVPTTSSMTGTLEIEIVYSGSWYRETFGYEPDAPNIRHMALVLPLDGQTLTYPGYLFSSLVFTPSPEPFQLREEAFEYTPLLEFLHDAPGGMASIELAPGKYNLAVAFIAAALPPPDDDAILYPGVTGGGASNDFQEVEIAAGETMRLIVELTDENGWGWLGLLALK